MLVSGGTVFALCLGSVVPMIHQHDGAFCIGEHKRVAKFRREVSTNFMPCNQHVICCTFTSIKLYVFVERPHCVRFPCGSIEPFCVVSKFGLPTLIIRYLLYHDTHICSFVFRVTMEISEQYVHEVSGCSDETPGVLL
uniref:Putative secreted protein n=1 Tax=Ixodes ricinus TaxID=34613 RepID=A0A6B0USN2_IXORI